MFGEQYSPEVRELLTFLAENIRRPRRIAGFVAGYMDALAAAGNPNQQSLLGAVQAPAKRDLMNAAVKATEKDAHGTTDNAQSSLLGQDASAGQESGKQTSDAPSDRGRTESRSEEHT